MENYISTNNKKTIVGAIRWDAWHSYRGVPGKAVEKSLGPSRWHFRLPFFSRVIDENEVEIDGASQEIMDREIAFAKNAGLDYWAFVAYEIDDPMSIALDNYLNSEYKRDINFCLITEMSRWGNKDNYLNKIHRYIRLMTEEGYQKVLNNRPIIYIGFISEENIKQNWSNIGEFKKAIDMFRALAQEAGVQDPYIVVMDFDAIKGKSYADELGCDAISSYAASDQEAVQKTYCDLENYAYDFWEKCKTTGSNVVPTVMTGWNRRPRVENPVPWETWQIQGDGFEKYYQTPKPHELAHHLEKALKWLKENPEAAPAQTIIIYAWNENDEGGWLVPTIEEGSARLEAIGKHLRDCIS